MKSPCFDLFTYWLMKQITNTVPKPFFKVIRKSLYQLSRYLLWLNNVDQDCIQKFLRCSLSFLYDGTHHIKHEILNFIGMIFTKIENKETEF